MVKPFTVITAATALLASLLLSNICPGLAACTGSDCVTYDISTQSQCIEVANAPPTYDCRWFSGLYANIDQLTKGGRIIAYQIQWYRGRWSDWFVPGINDIDKVFNVHAVSCSVPHASNGLRRMWSYFNDHNHRYIICKAP